MDHSKQDAGNQNEVNFVKNQPLLALSSVGAIVGSMNALMRKIKRISSINLLWMPRKYTKFLPKHLKSNYIAVPVLAVILLTSARKIRSTMVQ